MGSTDVIAGLTGRRIDWLAYFAVLLLVGRQALTYAGWAVIDVAVRLEIWPADGILINGRSPTLPSIAVGGPVPRLPPVMPHAVFTRHLRRRVAQTYRHRARGRRLVRPDVP